MSPGIHPRPSGAGRPRPLSSLPAAVLLLGLSTFACAEGGGHDPLTWSERASTVEAYDPVADRWFDEPRMPVPSEHAQGVVVDRILYAIGGRSGSYNFLKLDLEEGRWERLPHLALPRDDHAVAALDTDIYVIGGRNIGRDVAVYDTLAETWTAGPPLLEDRDRHEAVSLGGMIYAIGSSRSSTVEALDPASGVWSRRADYPTSHHNPAAGTDGIRLYVAGGRAASGLQDTLWIYDPPLDAWTEGPMLPSTIGGFGEGAVIGGEFLVVAKGQQNPRVILSYDISGGVWRFVRPMRLRRSDPGVIASPTALYVLGGG